MNMNQNFKSSSEISELIENFPLSNDLQKEISKKVSLELENLSKYTPINSDVNFQNILNQFKGTFDSTQGSEQIAERSSFNYISETDIAEDDEEDIFSDDKQKMNFEGSLVQRLKGEPNRLSNETSPNRNQQVLSCSQNQKLLIYFNEIEEKINNWLDSQGIKQVSPLEKQDDYFEEKKKIISSHILFNKSMTDIPEDTKDTKLTVRKQSLLERRKQQNFNLRKTTLSPSSCIDLDTFSHNSQQDRPALFTAINL